MLNQITDEQSLDKIEKNIDTEIVGKQFWGDLEVIPVEYDVLKNLLKEFLHSSGGSVSQLCKRYPNCLTTFLTSLVKFRFNYNFWGLLSEELSIPVYGPVENKIGECARSTFEKYGFDFSDVKDERRINLEPILYEAGIPPESSLNDLFYILSYDAHTIFDPQLIVEDLIDMRSYKIRKPMLKFLRRFKEDRAVEFVLEVHEAMLCVDQNRTGDSHYIANYEVWKGNERTKESISNRKKQEYQTKPYITFENGDHGLCMLLPRAILKDEWIESVQWSIEDESGFETIKQVEVRGDEGQRYVDSLTVPIVPAERYIVKLLDNEKLEANAILDWEIEGVRKDECVFFNCNGRLINPSYLPQPYGIMIYGKEAGILESMGLIVNHQNYPHSSSEYEIVSIEIVNNQNSFLSYRQKGKPTSLVCRPWVDIIVKGDTLFSLPITDEYHLFTEIPLVEVQTEEGSMVSGFELRLGNTRRNIEEFFSGGVAKVSLEKYFREELQEFGTYSIRLYQNDHFIRQVEFSYLPAIETNYSPVLIWPKSLTNTSHRRLTFAVIQNWEIEFTGGTVIKDNKYKVEFAGNIGYLSLKIISTNERKKQEYSVKLPINPIECCLWDDQGQPIDENSRKTIRMGLDKLQNDDYWLHLNSYGNFTGKSFSVLLRSVNGIEQIVPVQMGQKSCGNLNTNIFRDTMANCPLPCRLEVACEGDTEHAIPILTITDTVSLESRPMVFQGSKIAIVKHLSLDGASLSLLRFGPDHVKYHIPFSSSSIRQLKSNNKTVPGRVYRCDENILPGIYHIESSKAQETESLFDSDDNQEFGLTHGNETIFVSTRDRTLPILTIRDWLDQLIWDILSCGQSKDLSDRPSYLMIDKLLSLEKQELTTDDYEKLIILAALAQAKCANSKKEMIYDCIHRLSEYFLDSHMRYQIVLLLDKIDCSRELFEICLNHYNLYLFETGREDAISLAGRIEERSLALSMLLRMSANDSIRNAIWREKYIDLLGKEAIRSLLAVPGKDDPNVIAEEQKKFVREKGNSEVRIHLSPDISGEMTPIQDMLVISYGKTFLDLKKKPDSGLYFDHIRYVDQYVNWFKLNYDSRQEMLAKTRSRINHTVQNYCVELVKQKKILLKHPIIGAILKEYDSALRSRSEDDPTSDLSTCKLPRYFYLQGLAAFMSRLPANQPDYNEAIHIGEQFMANAILIAPRISRRDLIMASTYIYLKRKEAKLCQ